MDYWIDLKPDRLSHMMGVAREVAAAVQDAFQPTKVGAVIAGIEVRHVHIQLVPIKP